MAHHNTVFAQLLKVLPRHEFEHLAGVHRTGRRLRKMTRWNQFLSLVMAQLSGRTSLRDLVANWRAQASKLYHLGASLVARTSLARVNERQPYTLFEAIFARLLRRCEASAPKHRFRFKNKLYSLDASIIDLSLSLFPWASYQPWKGAIKLHVGLDHSGYLPSFLTVTTGKEYELAWARRLKLPARSVVVFDRGFNDFSWFNELKTKKIYFVTRLKKDTLYRVLARHEPPAHSGVTSDETIELTGRYGRKYDGPLRRVGYRDPVTGHQYVYLTNALHLSAATIAEVYRERWQIELFFKWIKQNLKIKSFLGTSRNAVLTQIWVAMCVYLLLAWLKFMTQLDRSLQEILRLLQLNLFERRSLFRLLSGDLPRPPDPMSQQTLQLAW